MSDKSYTDVVFNATSLYIEGVQVPFNAISISCGVGGLPTAVISVPVQAGLMDIARFYQPKVHIFFQDVLNDYEISNEAQKLIFSGLISQVSYSKSKSLGAGASISFQCVHKYFPINECLLDYTGWLGPNPMVANAGGGTKVDTANSVSSIIEALTGVEGISDGSKANSDQVVSKYNPDGRTDLIPPEFADNATRLIGMPGVLVNYWNQLKRSAYNSSMQKNQNYENEAFVKMYQPLLEKGLQFFNRLGGHLPVEFALATTKQESCPDDAKQSKKIIIPPCNQNFMQSNVQASMTIANVQNTLQQSGELTTIYQIFSNFFETVDYDILTLSAPAEAPIPPALDTSNKSTDAEQIMSITSDGKTSAVDTIVKPRLPFYFSPTCNVLFPGMYHTINVMYDEANIPTRVDIANPEAIESSYGHHFRAPHSVREAIAKKVNSFNSTIPYGLLATTNTSQGAVGMYEQGRGVKMESMYFPRWLTMFSQSAFEGATDSEKSPTEGEDPIAFTNLQKLSKGWQKRYPGDYNSSMNPYSTDAGISAHQRTLFSTADYYYTQIFARSKAGSVECLFNPYITPGYPMDILEKNPLYPSFHAHCTSVTHTITAESCATSVQFTAAMTYSELANYYIPFVHPFLQTTLELAEDASMLYPSEDAYRTADVYYRYTLGVPSIAPTDLMDFNTGVIYPHKWNSEGDWEKGSEAPLTGSNGGEMNPMLSFQGNLSLVQRPIENKADVEERFILKFIDMKPENYASTVIKYKDGALDEASKFEIGRSQFLDYDYYFDNKVTKRDSEGNVVDDTSFI